ncbi:Formyl peptide receptor-related sequence 7 [Holothuria leucospilota]|uniref:Formyl peptide receptor-related sequence 7 n=1 Tax=Holothuria leucospilota TaxID=206669 RepID=A0A9Q1BDC9_HOLLE|nr:Formyl peptide receptor-related sequence 7 [Holothuria leucospilota]
MPPSPLGRIYCILIHEETLFWVSIKASIFLIMTISIESATAVRKPMLYKNVFCNKCYRRLITLSIWFMAFLTNTHHYFTDVVDDNGKCNSTLGDESGSSIGADAIVVSLYIYGVTYILPLIVMITSYSLTASRLRKNMSKMNRRNSVLMRARYRVIGVVLIDIIVFFVCITPHQLVYLLECFDKEIDVPELYELVNNFDKLLLSIYVCANPIIYTITNPQFRLTLRIIWERITRGNRADSHWISNMPPETSLDLRTQNGCSE